VYREIKKTCIITGSRAEYGILRPLIKRINDSSYLDLKIIATGMHLSHEFGFTYKDIENDGYSVDYKVDMLLSSDSDIGVGKSTGLGIIGFVDALSNLNPDVVVVLGDRFEIFSAAVAATMLKIPIAHISGGEASEGSIDESIRHCITKMSHLHFTATNEYMYRVVQLGENPDRVFNVGAIGADSINSIQLLSKNDFEDSVGIKLNKYNLLVTFHASNLEHNLSNQHFANLLSVLDKLKDTSIIFTKSNADSGGRCINKMIDEYVLKNYNKSVAHTSLGQVRYLSAMKYVNGVVGNSSSGIIEAPSFKIGTINIGDRQKGRVRADSVIDCNTDKQSIEKGVSTLYTKKFQDKMHNFFNPYDGGDVSKNITSILEKVSLNNILKKSFYNLPYE